MIFAIAGTLLLIYFGRKDMTILRLVLWTSIAIGALWLTVSSARQPCQRIKQFSLGNVTLAQSCAER